MSSPNSLPKPAVLFLCVHNAGRSQMAAGWLRHLAMAEVGIDIATQQPQIWTDKMAGMVDVIVTMGCGDVCPVLPSQRQEDWALADPAGQGIEMVREVRDEIRGRVEQLIASFGSHQ